MLLTTEQMNAKRSYFDGTIPLLFAKGEKIANALMQNDLILSASNVTKKLNHNKECLLLYGTEYVF